MTMKMKMKMKMNSKIRVAASAGASIVSKARVRFHGNFRISSSNFNYSLPRNYSNNAKIRDYYVDAPQLFLNSVREQCKLGQLELSGLRPNMHSIGILANCYCNLGHVDFGFSLLGKRLKLGYPLDDVIFSTLINGLIHTDKLDQAVKLLEKIVYLGFQPTVVTHNAMVKGLCRRGDNVGALKVP
ncbi:hypothetical protein Cgig2_015174 [Carnegiea gigantea]|uniref:Pentatricopeptide repeat-containing protein n=1 Tax=Carnegiea gigantea TaxID=171969 RepID=A0A9Q1QNB8_9CARY|nr:hypothetical protein Cgig2_015174 [Carnegiea gigantea]